MLSLLLLLILQDIHTLPATSTKPALTATPLILDSGKLPTTRLSMLLPANQPQLTVKLIPVGVATVGTWARVDVTVIPHPDNRKLTFTMMMNEIEYSLSERQLEGAQAPLRYGFQLRDLPEGDYIAIVKVTRLVEGKVREFTARSGQLVVR